MSIIGLAKINIPTVAGMVKKSTLLIDAFITFLPFKTSPSEKERAKIGKIIAVTAVIKMPKIKVFILFETFKIAGALSLIPDARFLLTKTLISFTEVETKTGKDKITASLTYLSLKFTMNFGLKPILKELGIKKIIWTKTAMTEATVKPKTPKVFEKQAR